MIVAQHSGGGSNDGDADRKSPIPGTIASSLSAYTGILSTGFPSNFSQNPMGIFRPSGIRTYGDAESTSITTSSGLHEALSSSIIPGIPGLAPTSHSHGDMRSSFEQRRRQYFGAIGADLKGHSNDFTVKRENDMCGKDGHGLRIGLNLGVRTYFSTEDTAAGRFGKRHRASSPGSQAPMCQAEGCKADLSTAKHYHRRHKVCEQHSKAANVVAAGQTQRFCQQCSRFHILSEFDEGKRSCRKRLADHNRRRRKPQPAASTCGGSVLESVPPKLDEHGNPTCASSKPNLMHLKKAGSPSTASMEDSDGKTGSVGNNLQLRASSGFEPSHTTLLNCSFNTVSGPDGQALLSAMSNTPPLPLIIQNAKHQLSIHPGSSQAAAAYQHFLEGVGGTNLSLSSIGRVGFGSHRSSSGLNFSGGEPPVPWLPPRGSRPDTCQSGRGNMGHLTSEKNIRGLHHSVESCAATVGQVYSTSIQNLPPSMQSREIGGSEWILGNQDNGPHFISSGLSNIPGGHHFNPLENLAETQGALVGEQWRAVEFLQQNGSEGLDGTQASGIDPKFPELQALRPGNFGPSIYDSDHNVL
ncbi:unnamed protein product [Calypogeia fissa]